MKKLIATTFCICFVFLCCCGEADTSSHPDIVIKMPDGSVADSQNTLNGSIDKNQVTVGKPGSIYEIYIGNSTTKKFHLTSCAWADKIKPENEVRLSSYDDYINKGYLPCKTCNP